MSIETKKDEIRNVAKKYANNNIFDVSKFRKEQAGIYSTLPYYFGGIDNLLDELGFIKVQKSKDKLTLRNKLAYDMLVELRKKYTLEEIGNMYGVSRAAINQLYQALETATKVAKLQNEAEQ